MIQSTVELIDPERARELIDRSVEFVNRPVRPSAVERYAREMSNGRWKLNGEAVVIDEAGVVIDGQHRLHACVRAGVAFETIVVSNVPRSAFDTLDIGLARTTADYLHEIGIARSKFAAPACRIAGAVSYATGEVGGWQGYMKSLTREELAEIANTVRGKMILDAITPALRISRNLGIQGAATWLAVAITDIRLAQPELAEEFLERLGDGLMLRPGSPLIACRRYLMSASGYVRVQSGLRPCIGLAIVFKTFNSWLKGEQVVQVAFRSDERFPAPGVDFTAAGRPRPIATGGQ